MKAYTQKGFTLLELVIVIILLSILSATALITWPSMSINLGAQAQQLADDLRYTQSMAMNKGTRYYLIKLTSTSYQIRTLAGSAVTLPTGGTTVTLGSGITFGTLTNLPNSLVTFDGKGAPYTDTGTPGTALASTATIPLTSGGVTRTVSIYPQTGRAIVS